MQNNLPKYILTKENSLREDPNGNITFVAQAVEFAKLHAADAKTAWAECEVLRAKVAALEAALSAAEPVSRRNDEAGYIEFLNEDVPYIVRDIQGAVAILMDLETRNVIGYRVYDPDSVFAPQPAPSVAVKDGGSE